ncbi:MAG: rhomboid family intramembrane serine protease [Actinobacteria bacterium]|nr:rhomboid family intramembrane serine protease [Actinomycetota bacterium]MBO0833948.1 rhomboid family intramembrane serine protease [Actinomycetota bacterium]
MTSVPDKIAQLGMRFLPAPLARRLGAEGARRFVRFVAAALAAVITSQLVLGILTGPVYLSAGASGVIAAAVAALVSYLMSRWAWERKGKPDLLRETLPFWAVSLGVWIILGLTSHTASVWAHSMGYTHLKRHLVVQGAYFLMNCITFVSRFLIFHYLLFASRDRKPVVALPEEIQAAEVVPGGSGDTGEMSALSADSVPGR